MLFLSTLPFCQIYIDLVLLMILNLLLSELLADIDTFDLKW